MEEPRIKAGLWVKMALRMGDIDGRPGMVVRRGDPDAGGILVVLRRRDEVSVLSQVRAAGESAWMRATGPAGVDDATADAYIERQVKRDPDLWVVEFVAPEFAAAIRGAFGVSARGITGVCVKSVGSAVALGSHTVSNCPIHLALATDGGIVWSPRGGGASPVLPSPRLR